MRIHIAEDEDHHEDLPIFKYHGLCSVHTEDDWASLITQVGSDKVSIIITSFNITSDAYMFTD